MLFFNKKSELDDIRKEISEVIRYFTTDNERMDDRITELYRAVNTSERTLDEKINREVSYIERRIDDINNDMKILGNIGLGLLGLLIVILCVIIGYSITH